MSIDIALQSSIYTLLNGNIGCDVYDSPPKVPQYPYVIIGDDSFIPFDTDNTVGRDIIASIHLWDNYAGKKRIKTIAGEIDALMNRAEFPIAGFHLINCFFDGSDYFLDSDGKTYHGILTFRLLVDED